MGYPDYRRDLEAEPFDIGRTLDRYYHSGVSFVFWGADPNEESTFRRDLARQLNEAFDARIHPLELIICGSAHLGFSPVPDKLGKPFDPEQSDIDVAIVSTDLFNRWWGELVELANDVTPALQRRIESDLFWGFINPANLQSRSKFGQTWWDVFGKLNYYRAKGVRGRLYRNHWAMQEYHKYGIREGRKMLLKRKA